MSARQKDSKKSAGGIRRDDRAAKRKKKNLRILLAVIGGLLVLCLIGGGIALAVRAIQNAEADSGQEYRNTPLFQTDHFEVNAAMLSYCFYEYLYENDVLTSLNAETPEDLRKIFFTDENGVTNPQMNRFRYYAELTASTLESAILFAEAAVQKGLSLEAEEAGISARLAAIEANASSQGQKTDAYLAAHYGRGVKLSDVRAVLTLRMLAQKNLAQVYAGQSVSPEEIAAYVAENEEYEYYRVDYLLYDFLIGDPAKTEKYQEKHDDALRKAQELAACGTPEAFLEKAEAFLREEYEDDPDFSESDLQALLKNCTVRGRKIDPSSPSSLDRWLFSFDRKENETLALDGEISLGTVMVLRPAYSVDEAQKAVRVLSIDPKNHEKLSLAAEKLQQAQQAFSSDPREERFIELVGQMGEDPLYAETGGLVEDTYANTAFNKLIASWLDGAGKGDTKTFSQDDGLYLVYCCGPGRTRAEIDATLAVKSEKYRNETARYYDLYRFEDHLENVQKIAPLYEG